MFITFKDHPRALRTFFTTEMWERYGFYVVQTLLVLYLSMFFQWHDKEAFALIGAFTALTYISPLFGGWIADNLIGQKRAIIIATLILFASYVALSWLNTDRGLPMALAGIAVGTGFLKPNISSLLGNSYKKGSPHRENGFTLFYLGITTGIILGTTVPSAIQHNFGWPAAFLSAAIGMIFAFWVFIYGIYRFKITDYTPYQHQPEKYVKAITIMFLMWSGSLTIFYFPIVANSVFLLISLVAAGYIIDTMRKENKKQAKKTAIIGLLCIISIVFWAFYFQIFSSFILLIQRTVQDSIFGFRFPPPYYVTIESIGMMVFGVIFALRKQHRKTIGNPNKIASKFIRALLFMLLTYGLILFILKYNLNNHLIYPLLLIPAFLLISIAELLLSPVGLYAITMLASPIRVSTMMGIFFVSLGMGGFLSGKLASITAISTPNDLTVRTIKELYISSFSQLFYILLIATIVCFFIKLVIFWLTKDNN